MKLATTRLSIGDEHEMEKKTFLKTATALSIACCLLSCVLPGWAQEEDGEGQLVEDAAVKRPAAVLISTLTPGGREAHALCIAAASLAPPKAFCYYRINGNKYRDDDETYIGGIRARDNADAYASWIENLELQGYFENARAELDPLPDLFLNDLARLIDGFGNELDVLEARHIDLRQADPPPLLRAGNRNELGRLAHRLTFGVAALAAPREAAPAPEANLLEAEIAKLQNDNKLLESEKERLEKYLDKANNEIKQLKGQLGIATRDASEDGSLADQLKIALAVVLVAGLLAAGIAAFVSRRRRESNRDATLSDDSASLISKNPQQAHKDIGNAVKALRRHANNRGDAKAANIIHGNCDLIENAREQLASSQPNGASASTSEVERRLQEILQPEGIKAQSLPTMITQLASLFDCWRKRLQRFTGNQNVSSIEELVRHAEDSLARLRTSPMTSTTPPTPNSFANMSFSSESHERAPTDLDDLGRAWHKLEAKSRLGEQLLVRIDGLSLQEGFDLERKQGSILTKIQAVNTKLAQANGISRRLEKLRQRQGQDEPSILEDLEHIFQDVYQRGRLPSYCEVKSHLDRLYEQTDHIAQTYLGAGAGIAPLAALQLVAAKLDDSRIEADELQAQAAALRQAAADKSEELANATGQLESVRRRLDAPEASATSILYQLEQREADRDEAFKLLAEFRHNGANSLVDATRNAVDCLDRTRQTLAASLPEEPREGRADVLAERLSERHRELRQNANRAADLCGKFSEYLGFNQLSPSGRQEIDRLHALLDAEMASPHRPLRLGLAASLIAWREALAPIDGRLNGSHVAHALRLDPIDKGLRQLLQRLETTATDDLWTHGLRPGFSRDWLHALFRAQLLLRSFYVDHPELHVLEDAVTLASATVRSAMRRLGKGIEDVELLSPFPDNSRPGWAPPRYLADADLRMLPEVNRRVLGLLDDEKRDNFIVDVERFRLTGDREIAGECRVVVVNPAEWRQSQEV